MAAAVVPTDDCECPVCSEIYAEPKLLPCTHRICKKCILSWLASQNHDAGCPLCRVPMLTAPAETAGSFTDSMESLVDALPTDLATVSMAESQAALNGQHECHICDTSTPATSFCFDCSLKLCASCVKAHPKFPSFSDHVLETVHALTAERLASCRPSFCVVHTKRPAELYCCDHEALICVVCSSSDHRACSEVSSLDAAVKERREGFVEQAVRLRQKEAEFAAQIAALEKEIHDDKAHYKKTRSEVKAKCGRLQQAVATRQQQLLIAIDDHERQSLAPKTAAKVSCSRRQPWPPTRGP